MTIQYQCDSPCIKMWYNTILGFFCQNYFILTMNTTYNSRDNGNNKSDGDNNNNKNIDDM